jgi:SAM-dependent methyltransferase
MHINYLKNYIKNNHINNVDIFEYQAIGWGLKSSIKADLIYIGSLYHIIYAAFTDGERDLFVGNIKNYLKKDGHLVVVDNDLVEGEGLPYHGPYISRDMIISQLWHYGFELVAQYQFTLQRYVLQFKLSATPQKKTDAPVSIPAMFTDEKTRNVIRVTSPSSLVRFRMIGASTEGYTLLGKKSARLFYAALEKKDEAAVETALHAYEELIPKERFGDEYTVFEWVCKYLLASKERQTQLLGDKFDAEYFNCLANDDFAWLKRYVRIKYDLDKADPEAPRTGDEFTDTRVHDVTYEYSGDEVSFDQLNEWNEFIAFNNINRESWEKTSEMLNYINIKDGEAVADVGCGFGFFSFKFSQLVGQNGEVYSTEINKNYLKYVEKISSKYGLNNIQTVQARFNDACLPADSVDTIFMCSMYHYAYIATIEFVKDELIASLKKALKKGGRLVIVDNAITPPPVVAYHGSGIAKELTISQLKYYGFDLVDSKQFIPQRYVLVFQQG